MRSAFTAIVSGHVHGVMYRDFVQRKATLLGIVGEVENMPDGTVRVYAEGEKSELEKLTELLKQGPTFARVDSVHVSWCEPINVCQDFSITYSNGKG